MTDLLEFNELILLQSPSQLNILFKFDDSLFQLNLRIYKVADWPWQTAQ